MSSSCVIFDKDVLCQNEWRLPVQLRSSRGLRVDALVMPRGVTFSKEVEVPVDEVQAMTLIPNGPVLPKFDPCV